MSHAITIDALSYRAGRHFAIRDLTMRVPNGSVYGFLGPNGSGKTTTIRLLLGMLPPVDGTVTVLGHEIPSGAHSALARIGYVPERLHLYPMLTVAETMRYHASFYTRWDAAEAERLRRAFDLRDEQRVGRLSKGEAGKLMMLLALAVRPELLVLDEPTDGLDPVVRRDVLAALLEYVSTHNATVLISSHLVHEQERVCDWIGVMDAWSTRGGDADACVPRRHQTTTYCRRARAGDLDSVRYPRAPGRTGPRRRMGRARLAR